MRHWAKGQYRCSKKAAEDIGRPSLGSASPDVTTVAPRRTVETQDKFIRRLRGRHRMACPTVPRVSVTRRHKRPSERRQSSLFSGGFWSETKSSEDHGRLALKTVRLSLGSASRDRRSGRTEGRQGIYLGKERRTSWSVHYAKGCTTDTERDRLRLMEKKKVLEVSVSLGDKSTLGRRCWNGLRKSARTA